MAEQRSNLLLNKTYDITKLLSSYKKDIFENIFFNNFDTLIKGCELVRFQKNWKYHPDFFCLDYYDDSNFFPAILTVNNLGSIFEFKPENLFKELIISPNKSKIIRLLSLA